MILVDTGPLVAVGAADDHHHEACTELLSSATEELLVPATVSAEVCYLLERRAGSKSEAAFLRLFPAGRLVPAGITPLTMSAWRSSSYCVRRLAAPRTDASLIAIAERLGVTRVATLDSRHFGSIRPRHVKAFTLLPERL